MRSVFTGLFSLLLPLALAAQGMIVNEYSNGTTGGREFVEFLVIGSSADPTGNVNLSGWIIDDNNGDFGNTSTGVGVATGHARISAACLSSVPVGSLIVVYNAAEKHEAIALADDVDDSNGDGVYIIASNSSCLQYCTTLPNASPANRNYGACTYVAPTGTGNWTNSLALGNTADAFQVRRPDASFFHGYSYGGTTGTVSVSFPAELGGGLAFRDTSGALGGRSIAAGCGDIRSAATYFSQAATGDSPAASNNAENEIMIQNIKNGNFDYTNWANPDNCILLPLELLSFSARALPERQANRLLWEMAKVDPQSWVNIQRSADGIRFENIGRLDLQAATERTSYEFWDVAPLAQSYYRLEMQEPFSAKISYSPIVSAEHTPTNGNTITLLPNPVRNELTVALLEAAEADYSLEILDYTGRSLEKRQLASGQLYAHIQTGHLPAGAYILRVTSYELQVAMVRKFIKQ